MERLEAPGKLVRRWGRQMLTALAVIVGVVVVLIVGAILSVVAEAWSH